MYLKIKISNIYIYMPFYSRDMIGGAMDASHIYYNINISNDYSGYDISSNGQIMQVNTNDKELQLVFNQSRAQPYLINPSEYFLSVQRFTIESPNLPVFICQPIVGQANVNRSIYKITIQRQSDSLIGTDEITWQPDDKSVPIPSGTVTTSWQTDKYYYCYSYQHFIDLINNLFESYVTSGFITGTAPYMYFDTNTHLFTIGGNSTLYRTDLYGRYAGTLGSSYKIFFNVELYNLFSSLKALYVGKTGPTTGADYQLIMDTGSNDALATVPQPYITNIYVNPRTNTTGGSDTNDVINTQEYSTLPLWTPIKNIVFRTSLLNVAPDIVGTPIVFEQGNLNINSGKNNSDILNIMIDHTVPLTIGTEYRPFIYFEPIGEFRLVELYGNQPINSMDIAVFWKDSFGNLIPFVLDIGASATIKLLFRKKSFNSDKI